MLNRKDPGTNMDLPIYRFEICLGGKVSKGFGEEA
jgi:hypothetical protein